jgi:hypothetical protein
MADCTGAPTSAAESGSRGGDDANALGRPPTQPGMHFTTCATPIRFAPSLLPERVSQPPTMIVGGPLTSRTCVGDTGIEPVTSSV